MAYFYHWSAKSKKLFCHSGEVMTYDTGGGTYFKTNDGSNKRYLHCDYERTYSWNQTILKNKNDVEAINKLIEQGKKYLPYCKNNLSFINSITALKELKNKKEGNKIDGCCFCTSTTNEREMITGFNLNLGMFGYGKVSTYINDKNFIITEATLEKPIEVNLESSKIRIKYCPMCGREL